MVKRLKKEWKNIVFNFVFVLASILVVFLFYRSSAIIFVFLLGLALVGLIKWRSVPTTFMFVFGGLFGTLFNFVALYGIESYSVVSFIGVPLWLFIAWGNVSAFLYQVAIELERLGFHSE